MLERSSFSVFWLNLVSSPSGTESLSESWLSDASIFPKGLTIWTKCSPWIYMTEKSQHFKWLFSFKASHLKLNLSFSSSRFSISQLWSKCCKETFFFFFFFLAGLPLVVVNWPSWWVIPLNLWPLGPMLRDKQGHIEWFMPPAVKP